MKYLGAGICGAVASLAFLSGCGEPSSGAAVQAPAPEIVATPIAPVARYAQEDRGIYYYVADVPEEEAKKGKAAGDVIGFRYLGRNDKGEHILGLVGDDGAVISRSYCLEPCRVIRQSTGRIGFSSTSIIGAAFEDAIAGLLKPSGIAGAENATVFPRSVSTVPKPFRGAWDEMVADGCEAREARFLIEGTKFYNFEVEYDVTGVKLYSPREIDIRTTYKDENGSQQSDVWEFKLVDDGTALTGRRSSETFYRRCPNR